MIATRSVTLQAADSTFSKTLGLVSNLCIRVADIDFTVHAHVVDKAPFEFLIGRPFYAATSCTTNDFSSGEQHLTLTDLNSGDCKTISTSARSELVREQDF